MTQVFTSHPTRPWESTAHFTCGGVPPLAAPTQVLRMSPGNVTDLSAGLTQLVLVQHPILFLLSFGCLIYHPTSGHAAAVSHTHTSRHPSCRRAGYEGDTAATPCHLLGVTASVTKDTVTWWHLESHNGCSNRPYLPLVYSCTLCYLSQVYPQAQDPPFTCHVWTAQGRPRCRSGQRTRPGAHVFVVGTRRLHCTHAIQPATDTHPAMHTSPSQSYFLAKITLTVEDTRLGFLSCEDCEVCHCVVLCIECVVGVWCWAASLFTSFQSSIGDTLFWMWQPGVFKYTLL